MRNRLYDTLLTYFLPPTHTGSGGCVGGGSLTVPASLVLEGIGYFDDAAP